MTEEQAKTATLDELRDWLAGEDGWTKYPDDYWYKPGEWATMAHPHPPTLDGAAAALPEGWTWDRAFQYWSAYRTVDVKPGGYIVNTSTVVNVPDTGDEMADRYLLAVLCRIAAKERP